MAINLQRRRITVDEYYRMGEAGILRGGEHVELLRGDIVAMPPMGGRHRWTVGRLTRLLVLRFADVVHVQIQCPVVVLDDSVPEPDVALLNSDEATGERHAYPADVVALLEVADSSRDRDIRFKVPLYAQAGIREYWIVDLVDRVVRLYRDPTPAGYRTTAVARAGSTVAFEAFPDRELAVDELLPKD